MQFESNIDANNFFAGLQHPLEHHLVDPHMQADHFMSGHQARIFPEFIKHHHHAAPEPVAAQMSSTPGQHF